MTDDKSARAAELAIGLLEGREKQEALHDVTADPEMREAFRSWNERLASLCMAQPDPAQGPGAHVYTNIEAELFAPQSVAVKESFWDMLRAPENRGLVLMVLAAKVLLLTWILYLFL